MTTFSLSIKQVEAREKYRDRLLALVPWVDRSLLRVQDPLDFRDIYGRVLNAVVPDIDLLIVDEAHNLKHGFGRNVSNRNRVLGFALGHPEGIGDDCPWYAKRAKRVLLLSATPFEYDYADLYKQLDVLAFGNNLVRDAEGNDPIPVRRLCDPELPEEQKREIVSRMLLRRVAYLKIAGKKYSKNLYRREWRRGGFERHDEPMVLTDTKQRLVVGLIQKKVAEVLGDKRFSFLTDPQEPEHPIENSSYTGDNPRG